MAHGLSVSCVLYLLGGLAKPQGSTASFAARASHQLKYNKQRYPDDSLMRSLPTPLVVAAPMSEQLYDFLFHDVKQQSICKSLRIPAA